MDNAGALSTGGDHCPVPAVREAPLSMLVPMVILSFLCLLLGIFVEPLMEIVAPAVSLLLGGA